MKIGAAFPSTYLKCSDLEGNRVTVTISHVKIEEIADGEHKPVLYFQNKQKGLVLNKTNANAITDILKSDDTDDWTGQRIVLYPTRVDFQGKRVDAIRVDAAPAPAKPAKPAPKPQSQPDDDGDAFVAAVQADSDIPF